MSLQPRKLDSEDCQDYRQLWQLFKNGDIEAWRDIFTLFYKDLYGYGLKLSASPELTKDAIHELFVELWNRRNYVAQAKSVKAYLLASLKRKLLKRIKKKHKYLVDLENVEAQYSNKIQFSPEDLIIKKENLQTLREALEHLPGRQREVLYLRYYNGMSYDEIEEILEISCSE